MAAVARVTQYLSGIPNEAKPPVSGVTKPILISRPVVAALTVVVLAAPVVVVPPAVVVGPADVVVVVVPPPQASHQTSQSSSNADRCAGHAGHLQKVAPTVVSSH